MQQAPTRLFRTALAQGGYMAGSAFGFGWPITNPQSPVITSGLSPYGAQPYGTQGFSSNPFGFQQPYWQTPTVTPVGTVSPFSSQPLQQILQLLQIVPQQLQHV